MYEQYCRAVPHPTAPLERLSERDTSTGGQQKGENLSCGYCNVQCKAVTGLIKHCKQNRHKYEVFADSGRDVLWRYEPPPLDKKKISMAIHG